MIPLVTFLTVSCFLGLSVTAAGVAAGLERIEHCGTRCSQGLRCRTKPHPFFPPPCQNPAEGLTGSSAFPNVSLSTVLRCEGPQRCSLHLRVSATLQLAESIHGVSICTVSPGIIQSCQDFMFTKASRGRMSGKLVEVDSDCTKIALGQRVAVTVKTVPSYCGIDWRGTYEAPGCVRDDLKRHVPECITGRLSYDMDPQKKQLSVRVMDMREGHDYHLRLCRRDFICIGTGAKTLIKKEEAVKSAVLPYSRPLPCLCIEGWSAVVDAPRVQVCPFKDRLEELWLGINFDPFEGTLSWEPACPVTATVSLCRATESGSCTDLPGTSRNVTREKVSFTKVDPQPQLCMKFASHSSSWTRCPFVDESLQVWEVVVKARLGRWDVWMTSRVAATFSVQLCDKPEGSTTCRTLETCTVHVEKHKPVGLNLAGELCNSCLQVTRTDVNFSVPFVHCLDQCDPSSPVRPAISAWASRDLSWLIAPVGVFLSAVIAVAFALHLLVTMNQRRKQTPGCCSTSEKKTGAAPDCAGADSHVKSELLVLDSPRCGGATKKANLITV